MRLCDKQQTAGKLRVIQYAAGAHDSRTIHNISKGYCARKSGHELRKSWSCAGQTVPAVDGPTIQMSQLQMRSQVARCFSCSGRLSSTTVATRVQSRAARRVIPGLRGAAARRQQRASTWDLHCDSVGAKGFWVRPICNGQLGGTMKFKPTITRITCKCRSARGERGRHAV